MDGGISLGRVAGFPVSAHWSVLVILLLFSWSLATTLPATAPGHATSTYWLAGLAGAAMLIGCLLAHELTHAIVARRAGVEVKEVRLWLFGGIARLGSEAGDPRADFRIAASGPAVSLGLAALFAITAAVLQRLTGADLLVATAWWLAAINVILGVFNLIPGAPLDGGRILRAYLWRRHGDRVRATVGAARAGRVVAYLLIGLGLLDFLAGSLVGGIWMVFIGWFLYVAAREEELHAVTGEALAGVSVGQVMTPNPHTTPGWITVEDFITRYLLGDRHSAYPVEAPNGSITGLVSLTELRRVTPGDRNTTLVCDVAVPLEQVPTAGPDEPITSLLERLAGTAARRALVVDSGRVVGIITSNDITRLIDVRRLIQPAAER